MKYNGTVMLVRLNVGEEKYVNNGVISIFTRRSSLVVRSSCAEHSGCGARDGSVKG